ncbi:5-oxoprolinase subunit PxpB [Biomaibacter acetigenes]|uniref:5-oxoprolinase subunit PxpB n=1 Tax=Biomaibacter acetigenes TaxID=2316383 RepID=A0A3G2R2G7_9FIRM|nr:5-oxoprolinase subunit PxpB [Biomaibacter acetigenes]AYO29539.1 5-oxoprolinase subunit PxpB [Biomaibacter acetigenes]
MYEKPRILMCGDKAIVVEYGNEISEGCNKQIISLYRFLVREKVNGIVSLIPTYRSLLIKFEPTQISFQQLEDILSRFNPKEIEKDFNPLVIEIPVAYGEEFGPDLQYVAEFHSLTNEEVIQIHTEPLYRIYMLGFIIGFAYLGNMSEKIATPRLDKPRTIIPAGSVGIAGAQTGIYPLDSPGGWRLIGKTPVRLYDPQRERPILFQAGDYVRFKPISREEFFEIEEEVKKGSFQVRTYPYS